MPGNVRAMTTAPELDETDKSVLVALLHQVIARRPGSAFGTREPLTGNPLQARATL